MSADRAQQGRRNRANGAEAERQGLRIIRRWFPGADRGRGGVTTEDIVTTGVGDRVVEITRTSWDQCGAIKIGQAERYAHRAGLDDWAVMKMIPGRGGKPSRWYIITDASRYFETALELDTLRALETSEQAAFERGYETGRNHQPREDQR